MSIALAQSFLGANGTQTNVSPFTLSLSSIFPSSVAAGSCIVVFGSATTNVFSSSPTMNPSVTGGPTANWVSSSGTSINIAAPASTRSCYIYYLQNCPAINAGDSISVPFTVGGSGVSTQITAEFAVYVFTGVLAGANKFSPQDVTRNNNGTASTPSTTNIVTTKTDLILAGFVGDSGNISAGAGYTLGINMSVATFGQLQYILNQPAGSIATAFSGGTESHWAMGVSSLKPAVAVGFSFGQIIGA